MKDRNYYKMLISLYEATNSEINQQQVEIADSGNDVLPNVNKDKDDNNFNETAPEEINSDEIELDDANYLGDAPLQDVSMDSIMEKQKLEKLFDLFNNLLNYSQLFYESLVSINSEMISDEKKVSFIKYTKNVKDISDKINEYLVKIYPSDKYERVLYTYILLRTEFLTTLKELRNILELNIEELGDKK